MSDVKRWPTKDELTAMSVAERSQYIREHAAVAIAALPTAKRLLAEATPLPWSVNPWERGPGGTASVALLNDVEVRSMAPGATPQEDRADAALIVYAVNRLPDYEAAVDALERLLEAIGSQRRYIYQKEAARAALARLRESVPA